MGLFFFAMTAEFTINQPHHPKPIPRTPLPWVWSHLRRHPFLLAGQIVGAASNAILAMVVPYSIGLAFNAALRGDKVGIAWSAIIIIISQILRALLQFMRNYFANILGERLERDARSELYLSLLGKSMTFHALQPAGDTMARATNDVHEMNLMIAEGVNLVIGSSFFIIVPLLFAPYYHPALIFAPLFFAVGYALAVRHYLGRLQRVADDVRQAFGVLNGRLAEALDGIETVKGAAQEEQEIGRFRTHANTYQEAVIQQGEIEARYIPLLLLGLTTGIAFAHATWLYAHNLIDVGAVIGYVGSITLFGFPTFISLFAYAAIARGFAGARRILALIHTETHQDENKGGYQQPMRGEVTLENVTMSYLEGKPVLHNLSLIIPEGKTVAIVGQTGSGKSSLAKLINRTYDVKIGRVLIDGVDVRDWNLAALRRQISIIEQDIFLFSRSIGENIAFGNANATTADIESAARAAQAHDFISQFPEGYQTIVGERGVTLSGGQRQRIALARAFLAQPRILILDDSTSAVDSATEDKIQQAITQAAAHQTTILITHRLSQIRWADQVVLLKQGRIIAAGDHETLLRDHPAYSEIFPLAEG